MWFYRNQGWKSAHKIYESEFRVSQQNLFIRHRSFSLLVSKGYHQLSLPNIIYLFTEWRSNEVELRFLQIEDAAHYFDYQLSNTENGYFWENTRTILSA